MLHIPKLYVVGILLVMLTYLTHSPLAVELAPRTERPQSSSTTVTGRAPAAGRIYTILGGVRRSFCLSVFTK